MEAIPASLYSSTPQTAEISHLRSSQYSNSNPTNTNASVAQQLSAPASQESIASYQSAGSSAPRPHLEKSSSNVSQMTSYTASTSPYSVPEQIYDQRSGAVKPQTTRLQTPEGASINDLPGDEASAVFSPMSITSPAFSTNGTKRTASGHVKNAPSLPGTPTTTSTFGGARPRGDSISSTSSRAGELAMSLKTRLGYAMAKVQNGWEHRNITEVELLAAHKMHAHRHSMSHLDYARRPESSGSMNGVARTSLYEDHAYSQSALDHVVYPPSKRHSGHYPTYMQSSSQPVQGSTPRLQPAADIRPTTGYQQPYSQQYSTSQPQLHSHAHPSAMSPPRTPVNGTAHSHTRSHRPPTLRTETQTAEAERDALQALFQLGSPHGSQMSNHGHGHFNGNGYGQASRGYQHSQASSSQASPLRPEFAMSTPRRVTFARSESDSSALSGSTSNDGLGMGGSLGGRRESAVSES